jgi:signal transduction histidine kinase
MGEGAASPDRSPPVRVEMLHESDRTRVTRVIFSGRTVIRKEPLGPEGQRRLQHERAFLEQLRGAMGVAQLLDEPRYPGSITLADAGPESLAQAAKPLAVDDLIGLAEQLARAVAAMHGRGVMHCDICPANIVRSARGAPCLVDFASATSLAEIRPEFSHHTQIVGTLSYSAPEQTGRTGRPVDHRADLYALGATLYELATGEPPFGSGDALRLIHDHLARVPKPPIDINPAVGQALSAIIMHLLEKEPDDRYQSANGLIHDLVQLRELGSSTTPAPRVGARDFPLRLIPPSRLIGRDDEVATLQEAFDDALRGECRGVMVGGASGVGKTALIDHLRPVVTGNDGWFVAGKFDQYRRDLEFDGIFQAFRALGRLLLSEPDDELAELRERMLSALGPNASMASAVLPEFAVLLGVPPETGDPLTAQVRVQHSAVDMLRAVASPKRPVMLFVDDLQWAGPTSIGIIDLVLREQVEGLLLVGAHRTGMDPAHPLGVADADDSATLIELHTARHAALYSLGRLDEADEDYRVIHRLGGSALQRVDATCVQVRSLTGRKCLSEAVEVAVGALRELGVTLPDSDVLPELVARYFDYLYRWLDHTDVADDLVRPEITDPNLLAVTCLLNAAFPPAHWAGDAFTRAWLSLEAVRILLDHGTARGVLFPASYSTIGTIALRDDYQTAYRVARRILTSGEARGYEPETSQARFVFARFSSWFEPLEVSAHHARLAHEALAKCGDMATAGYAIHYSMTVQLDCAPSLDDFAAEVDAGLAFARRVGNEQLDQWLEDCRWLTTVLRGESSAAASAVAEPIDGYADNPTAQFSAHLPRAVAAAIIDDPAALTRHTFAAMQSLHLIPGNYATALARLLRGLALAADARAAQADERDGLLSELDDVIRWLAARAADAPENFGHMLRVLEAERAWSTGEFGAAAMAFDAACGEVAGRQRAWHRALITERAARFALAQGLQHAGFELLAHARQEYLAWGATAKVAQLDWAYPALRPHTDLPGESGADRAADLPRQGPMLTTGTIDLLAILSASQALSSETSIEGLHVRVVHVLAAMTGATAVQLVLWDEDRQVWLRPAQGGTAGPVGSVGSHHDVPMSVLRYAQRLTDPLVVADVTCDGRFAGDPYFADVDRCSLVALPILSRGRLSGMALLENRLIRGAFTAERLDAVKLIAGQLAVSLDNAQLYSELTASRARIVAASDQARRQIERDLHDGAQQRLVSLVLELGMAQAEVSTEEGELRMRLGHAGEQAREALKELRDLSRGIHPAILTEGGLGKALRAMTRRSPISVELDLRVEERLPDPVEISAYYIVAEALTNAAKHSGASEVRVCVEAEQADGALRLEVADDGVGGAEFSGGTGLMGLKDRVDALGGRIDLHSPRGGGTTLRVMLPLNQANGES